MIRCSLFELRVNKWLFLGMFFCNCFTAKAQTSYSKSDSLLYVLAGLQSKGDSFYHQGMFPSQRVHKKINYRKEDNNIFFTALISLTLQQIKPHLSPEGKLLTDTIINKAISNYPRYRNKNGGNTYNFWQTTPSNHFPNDSYFSKREKFIMPDDFDDTAIIYAGMQHNDSIAALVKKKMAIHTNMNGLHIKNTFKKYRKIKAYSTWFGKKMPIDFDICVHLNTLYFIYKYNLPLNESDQETIRIVRLIIESDEHIKYPDYVAPHYQQTSVILYHVARLISGHNVEGLNHIRSKVISDIKQQLLVTTGKYEKLLLETSLLKMGVSNSEITPEAIQNTDDEYYFFVNNFTSTFPHFFKKAFGKSKWLRFYHICKAYNICLELEHEVYINKISIK